MSAKHESPKKRRGSVLVFTVLLLVLLAGIGTAFVMFVNLEYAASGNALRNTQSRAAAETGLEHARGAIRRSLKNFRIESSEGFFRLEPATEYLDCTAASDPGLFRFFEYHPGIAKVDDAKAALTGGPWNLRKDFAWLFWNEEDQCGVSSLDGAASGTPHNSKEIRGHTYSESPLTHFAFPDGEPRSDRYKAVEHAGLARRFLVYAPVTAFYEAAPSQSVSPIRAEYYVWLADLDGKLYAPHNGYTWEMETAQAGEVLRALRNYGYGTSGWSFYPSTTSEFGMPLTDEDIGFPLPAQPTTMLGRSTQYLSVEELALHLRPKHDPDPAILSTKEKKWSYLYYRYGLERNFTCRADNEKSVKVRETALNINTASQEVLTAALSRIPMVAGDPLDYTKNLTKAYFLAKRICARRPFVCRMDFEDFLAAHLNEDPEGIPDSTADLSKPAGMIYAAILKRVYTNMSLENMLELPSGTDCSRFAFLQDRTQQQARFEWFRKDDDLVKYPLAQALLSAKAFNNILNSTSGTLNDLTGYGYSFYSFGGSSLPTAADAKFLYSLLTAGQESYGVDSHLLEWRASNHSLYGGYYEMSFSYDDRQIILPEDTSADPAQAVVDPGADLVLTTKPDSADTKVGETIQIGADLKAQTAVHARLKSYRTELEPVVANADSAVNNGDVAWSPRFCFRSRFFKVYVLARSIVTLKGSGAPVYGPTSRLEAVYDAVDDKILWRRWQATELRRLSDPVP